jgi:ribosomal protein S18 acetylase RimI-like enzyme
MGLASAGGVIAGMNIRRATEADAEAIAGVHVASMRAAYEDLFPEGALAQMDARDRAERWRQHLAGATSVTVLAEAGGRLVGFADFGSCRDEDLSPGAVGELMALYVLPDAWGSGVGSALMREALCRFRGDGFAEVVLWVIEGNRRAVRFYQRFGFVPDGSADRREMYGTPTTVVRLRFHAGVEAGEPSASTGRPDE